LIGGVKKVVGSSKQAYCHGPSAEGFEVFGDESGPKLFASANQEYRKGHDRYVTLKAQCISQPAESSCVSVWFWLCTHARRDSFNQPGLMQF
jgi:hypothetical protein